MRRGSITIYCFAEHERHVTFEHGHNPSGFQRKLSIHHTGGSTRVSLESQCLYHSHSSYILQTRWFRHIANLITLFQNMIWIMVYKTQHEIIDFIKSTLPHVTEVHYFTDGCAGQYKNC